MKESESRPPRLAEWLLERVVPEGVAGRSILGDAREEYAVHLGSGSYLRASFWYWRHVLSLVFRFASGGNRDLNGWTASSGASKVPLSGLFDDFRVSARSLLRKPGFALAAVLTLGLGIGANTTMFSLVHGVLIESLPYPNADELVGVYRIDPDVTGVNPTAGQLSGLYSVPYEVFLDWSEMSSAFEAAGAYFDRTLTWTGGDRPEVVPAAVATSGVFAALGVAPILGRTFQPGDDAVGAPALAVLGNGLWQRSFGGDPAVIGRQLTLSGLNYEIVGVMPPSFAFPYDQTDVWLTFEDERKTSPVRSGGYLQVIARLKQGISLQRAQLDVDRVAMRIGELHPEERDHGIGLFSRKSLEVSSVQGGLMLLFGAVGLVLLIACANITNLLLVRATERRRELGVRMALGANRARLLMQHLSESLLLAVVGGCVGVVIAVLTLGPFKAAFPGGLPRVDTISVDYRILVFATSLAVLTGLLTGVLPAIRAIRAPVVGALQDGGRSFAGGMRRSRTQAALVVGEVALAFLLLVGAGLFIRSLSRLTSVESGFETDGLLAMGISLPARYRDSDEASAQFFSEFTERLGGIPGVRSVGSASQMPFVGGYSTPPVVVETAEGFVQGNIHETTISLDYLSTMGIPIVAGRGFTDADQQGGELVALVTEAMVDRYWPGENPVGRRIGSAYVTGDSVWVTVVGVVRDFRYRLRMEPFAACYLPLPQWPQWYQWMVLRTEIPLPAIAPAVDEVLAALDPDVPTTVFSVEERIANSSTVSGPRFVVFVLGCLAGLAALLAFVGIYGVLAYTVQQRAQEIGIRLALGARAGTVVKNLLGRGLGMAGVGLALGIALAVGTSRIISSLLFQIRPTDPATLASVTLLVVTAAVGASYFPARRATKVDPVEVLRRE